MPGTMLSKTLVLIAYGSTYLFLVA